MTYATAATMVRNNNQQISHKNKVFSSDEEWIEWGGHRISAGVLCVLGVVGFGLMAGQAELDDFSDFVGSLSCWGMIISAGLVGGLMKPVLRGGTVGLVDDLSKGTGLAMVLMSSILMIYSLGTALENAATMELETPAMELTGYVASMVLVALSMVAYGAWFADGKSAMTQKPMTNQGEMHGMDNANNSNSNNSVTPVMSINNKR